MADVVPQAPPPSNRGLRMLVIGLGVAILIVVAAMIGMAIKRAVFDPKAPASATATLKPGEAPELNLDLAPGTSVAESRLDGATLIVRITGPFGMTTDIGARVRRHAADSRVPAATPSTYMPPTPFPREMQQSGASRRQRRTGATSRRSRPQGGAEVNGGGSPGRPR